MTKFRLSQVALTADACIMALPSRHYLAYTGIMTTVLIIEYHDRVRLALENHLRNASGIEIVGSTSSYDDAVLQAERLVPDVILLEVKAPGGIETLRRLCEDRLHCRVIVLTTYPDSREEDCTRGLGASRYLLKELDTTNLVHEIHAVARH